MINPAAPVPGTRLIARNALPEAGAVVVDFRNGEALFSLLIAQLDGRIRAYENSCPHVRMPLERFDGVVVFSAIDGAIVCAGHGASFRFADGACVGGPAKRGLSSFPVQVDDGWVVAA